MGVGKLRFLIPPQVNTPASPALPFVPSLGEIQRVDTPNLQGGYITVPNLLITTLALFSAASTQRAPVLFNRPSVPQVQVFQPPNLLTSTLAVAAAPLPPGQQQTLSAPVSGHRALTFEHGTNILVIPVVSSPVGRQQTDSAPRSPPNPGIDPPQNLAAQSAPQIIASSQSEGMPQIRPSEVEMWLPRNVTINLPTSNPLPPGRQQTDSAPATPRVLLWDRGSNTLLFTTPPAGRQQLDSAPPTTAVRVDQPPNLLTSTLAAAPLPPGQQRTESAPPLPPQVQSYEAPNAALFIPPPNALPPGQQWTYSIPIQPTDVWAQNSTIPPDLLPPAIIPVTALDRPAGGYWPDYGGRKRRVHGEVEKVTTHLELLQNIQQAKERLAQKQEARRQEARANYVTLQIKQLLDEQDRLHTSIEALKLQLEAAGLEDDEIALILSLC